MVPPIREAKVRIVKLALLASYGFCSILLVADKEHNTFFKNCQSHLPQQMERKIMMNTTASKCTVKGLILKVANWTLNPIWKKSRTIIKPWITAMISDEFVWFTTVAFMVLLVLSVLVLGSKIAFKLRKLRNAGSSNWLDHNGTVD